MKTFYDPQKTVIEILQDIGMTEIEANVYSFIFRNGGATSRDILRTLNLRQPQLYDITSGLERKGFINVMVGRPQKYEAIKPDIIYEQREEALRRMKGVFLRWAKENEPKRYRKEPEIFISRNYKGFLSNTVDIIESAESFVFIHTTPHDLKNYIETLSERARDGVRIFLMLFDNGYDEAYADDIIDKNVFSNIRYTKVGKFFTVISDNSLSSFMPRNVLLNEGSQKYGYIFRDSDMTWFIIHNFFAEWFKSNIVFDKIPILPVQSTNQRVALTDILVLKNSGMDRIMVKISGHLRTDWKTVQIEGEVSEIIIGEDIVNFTVKDKDGKKFTIGGFDSKVEDIVAETISIL
jgi:sugar-specific transcriptional regulator TrmB